LSKNQIQPYHITILQMLLFNLLKWPVRLFVNYKLNINCSHNDLLHEKGPALILGHHVTNYDPIITNMYAPRLVHFITSDINMNIPSRSFFLKLFGMVPFTKNNLDFQSIRKLHKLIRTGHFVALYPEGGRTWDGVTEPIIYSSAKLIKLLGVPVYITKFEGGYHSQPRWSDHIRKGKIIYSCHRCLTPEHFRTMSVDEIYKRIVAELAHDAYQEQFFDTHKLKSERRAESVERLLYKCPNCNFYDTLSSKGNYLICSHCNQSYYFNPYGRIENCEQFQTCHDWNRWQQTFLPSLWETNYSVFISQIRLTIFFNSHKTSSYYDIILNTNQLEISSNDDYIIIPLNNISGVSITFNNTVEFYFQDETFYIDSKEIKSSLQNDNTKIESSPRYVQKRYRLAFEIHKQPSIKLFYDLLNYYKERVNDVK